MSETAAAKSSSVNPNVPVGAESSVEANSGSGLTFDDMADVQDTPKRESPKPKLVKDDEPKKKPAKAEGFDTVEDDKPAAKGAKDEKKEAAASKDGAKDAKPKAKVHRAKVGDSMLDIPGDAVLSLPVGGEKVEIPLQDVINEFAGKTDYSKKYNAFHKEKTEFYGQRDALNTMVSNLYEKAQKDPEAAYDFLAELTKQDPVKLKGEVLRKQFDEMLPLFEMSPAEREVWFKDRERDWRDRAHAGRERAEKEREAQVAEQAKRTQVSEEYGLDEERWKRAEDLVAKYLKKADPKFDGKVTTEQVIYGDRQLMALEVIAEAVPHLEQHEKFDSIVGDIVQDLVRHPSMTREKLAKLLGEVWVTDKKVLKDLSRKAKAQADDDEPRTTARRPSSDALSFDDLTD